MYNPFALVGNKKTSSSVFISAGLFGVGASAGIISSPRRFFELGLERDGDSHERVLEVDEEAKDEDDDSGSGSTPLLLRRGLRLISVLSLYLSSLPPLFPSMGMPLFEKYLAESFSHALRDLEVVVVVVRVVERLSVWGSSLSKFSIESRFGVDCGGSSCSFE